MQANALYGVGLSAERLEEFASASAIGCGQAAAVLPGDWELDGAAVLAASLDDESFGEILGRGARTCIEIGGLGVADVAASLRLAQASSIFVCLTTVSAYRLQLAHRVTQALDRRRPIGEERCYDMELALQEAISNAVIHGNLAVSSLRGPTLAALDAFSCDLNERLADPTLANLRVGIAVSIDDAEIAIDVIDQGPGFVPKPRAPTTASGRGIGLIESLAAAWELLDDGRRVRMRFAR